MNTLQITLENKFCLDEIVKNYKKAVQHAYMETLTWVKEKHPEWLENSCIAKSCNPAWACLRMMHVEKVDEVVYVSFLKYDPTTYEEPRTANSPELVTEWVKYTINFNE
ncbi:MAG: hypothetical protein IKO36_05695 [Bacteroidaceae bacterium]|nr:hypothetical protein [Bacteroidaceae bacterium]